MLAASVGALIATTLLPPQEDPVAPSAPPEVTWGEWYVLGPFEHKAGSGNISREYGAEDELDRLVAGSPGLDLRTTYRGKSHETIRWMPVSGPGDQRIDFRNVLFAPPDAKNWYENAVVYLYRTIESSATRPVRVHVGSDDGLRLWWNGDLVVDANVGRGLDPHAHRLELVLEPGFNHVLAKISQGNGGWAFQMTEQRELDPESAAGVDEVETAIDSAVDYLLDTQLIDGSWGHAAPEYGSGSTGLAVYALLRAGVPRHHPAIRRALLYMQDHPPEKTYALGCVLLGVGATGDPEHLPWLEELADLMIEWQERSGLWAYPDKHADLSNTLFAALGLREASRMGVEIPKKVWLRSIEGTLDCQYRTQVVRDEDGRRRELAGFAYLPNYARKETGSMTTAGLSILAIAKTELGDQLPKNRAAQIADAEAQGLAWLERHFSVTDDPGGAARWQYFNLYGLERVGSLLSLESIGDRSWYAHGAESLIDRQGNQGQWSSPQGETLANTALGLLFLRRATSVAVTAAGEDRVPRGGAQFGALEQTRSEATGVRVRASGDAPTAMWVKLDDGVTPDRVEYMARPFEASLKAALSEFELLAAVDAASPAERRFATRTDFPKPGKWQLFARAHVGGTVIDSPPIEVAASGVLEDFMIRYATDARRNLLAGTRVEVKSSTEGGGAPARNAVDGFHGTWWFCKPDDVEPWLRVELRKPTRADTILFTHARTELGQSGKARPARLEVVVNGSRDHELVMPLEETRKGELDLGEVVTVRTIQIRIVRAQDGALGAARLGFAEIELQRRDR